MQSHYDASSLCIPVQDPSPHTTGHAPQSRSQDTQFSKTGVQMWSPQTGHATAPHALAHFPQSKLHWLHDSDAAQTRSPQNAGSTAPGSALASMATVRSVTVFAALFTVTWLFSASVLGWSRAFLMPAGTQMLRCGDCVKASCEAGIAETPPSRSPSTARCTSDLNIVDEEHFAAVALVLPNRK
jgi:hypothetical protein